MKYWKTALAILAALCASLALAEDFKTIEGKEYKNVKVSRVEPDGIVISFSGGIVKIPFTELSPEIQKKYGYDPKAAGDFQQQTYQADVTRARQLAEAKAKRAEQNAKYWSEHSTPVPAPPESRSAEPESRETHTSQVAPTPTRISGGSPPTRSLQQLEADRFSLIGRIIGVQFNYREDYTHRVDANWFSGGLNRYDPTAERQSHFETRAAALIPATALSWFQSLPSDFRGRRETVVYAHVEENGSGGTVLRLLGTQIRRDLSGAGEIIW